MEGAAVANDPAYGTGVLDAVSPVLVHNMKMHLPRTNPLDFQSAFSGVRTTRQLVKVDCRTLGRLNEVALPSAAATDASRVVISGQC